MDTLLYTSKVLKTFEEPSRTSLLSKHKHFISGERMSSEGDLLASNFRQSERLKRIKPSGIRRFFSLAQEIPDVISLAVGEPDFTPPIHALNAGMKAAKEGKTHYTLTNGISELREALAQKVYRDYGLHYDSKSEILVTIGGTEAIFISLMGMVNPGDEVLILNPGFVLYEPSVLLAGGIPVYIPLLEKNRFKPSVDDVMSLITDKSRVIILNFPNNPTGASLSQDEAATLAKVAVDHDLITISDEVYEKITYDGAEHNNLATFPEMRERTLVVNSFSKTYAMTGLRVGYIYGPKNLISSAWLVHQYTVACVNSLAQHIALAALTGPQDFVANMVEEFNKRRQLVHRRLLAIEGFRNVLPEGAFYAFPNIESFGMSSEDFAQFLLREGHVAVVPGSAFGDYGEGHIRISYATAYEQLETAFDRIEKAVERLN